MDGLGRANHVHRAHLPILWRRAERYHRDGTVHMFNVAQKCASLFGGDGSEPGERAVAAGSGDAWVEVAAGDPLCDHCICCSVRG